MPVPNYPDKHGASAYLTPSAFHESKDVAASDVPEAVVLCYQPPFFDHVVEAHTEAEVEYPGAGRLHSLSGTDGRVGVLGGFGIGGPVTAIAMEHLIELGTERFCVLGGCGGLGGNVAPGEPVVCDRAIRDDGVSHHYLPSERYADASERLVSVLADTFDGTDVDHRTGSSWTTDAIFRETVPEIEHYRDEGVLAVEMEAATVFAVAEYRDVDAAAVLRPFDLVLVDDWEPKAGSTVDGLAALLAPVRDALVVDIETHGSVSNAA